MSSAWLGTNRQEQLDMATVWETVFKEPVSNGTTIKYIVWGIPSGVVEELSNLVSAARDILEIAKNEETRTKVVDRQVASAFTVLVSAMRSIKRKFFYVPPLTEADLVSLRLKVPDQSPGPLGDPDAMITLLITLTGAYNQLRAKITAVSGNLNARNNRGPYHIKYGVFETDVPAPTDPSQLSGYLLTKRKKDTYKFPYNSSGKMAYFCARIEDGDRKGEWGPIVGARIP